MKKFAIPVAIGLLVFQAQATPVEFDTPDAHIIVVRPVDIWSGDKGWSEDSLDYVRKRKFNFMLGGNGGYFRGGPTVFQGVDDHPVTLGVESVLESMGADTCNCANNFKIEEPVAVPPEDMAAFVTSQENLYKRIIVLQGDPSALESKVSTRKLIGGLASAATFALFMGKMGVNEGLNAAENLNLPDAIYRVSYQYRGALIPANLPTIDFSQYKSVEIRRATYVPAPERIGQIVIAYKKAKTPDAETSALIKGIVSLVGADTTTDAVEKSRAADYAARVAIWSSCVAEGKCKPE